MSSRRLMVIGAHSADFVWRAGGACAVTTANGGEARVIALSYGERGESGELWKNQDPAHPQTIENVKKIRHGEAERAAGALGLAVADLLDVLDRLGVGGVRVLPELAGLALLPVGERDHPPSSAGRGRDRQRSAGAPHEIGGVGADHQHSGWVGPIHHGSAPATRRVLVTAITLTSSSLKPA
ncbi:MAG TPA: PIG-L family deacetylase, partial [Solirubrobacteraceae bacterium]|nr:PIG-L family deacetylase [Solirubrobacteraceae bacterium]